MFLFVYCEPHNAVFCAFKIVFIDNAICLKKMSRVTRKPVFGGFDQVTHKLGYMATENG